MDDHRFEWYDYLIFAGTLSISLGIGLYYAFAGGGQHTTKDYLFGGRQLKAVPVALSMIMSFMSAITVLGNTAEMYAWGSQNFISAIGCSISYIFTALVFVPLLYPLKLTSCFEYIQMRFQSQAVRLTGTLMMMVSQCLYMGLAIYAPAISLDAVTGFPTWLTIILTGTVGTVYTTMGGMKAVVWTDVFQFGVMIAGMIAVLIVGTMNDGSIGEVWTIASENERLNTFIFDPNPLRRASFWSILIGSFLGQTQMMTSQMSVQRFSSLSTLEDARKCLLLNVPGTLLIFIVACLTGLVVFAHYFDFGCDPLRTDLISSPNQLLPFFIIDTLKSKAPGLPGLFVSVLFSGALSTISSSLNSLAAVTWKDMLETKFNDIPEKRKATINKALVGFYGVFVMGIAFAAQFLGGHVMQASQSLVGGVAGPLLGIYILGAFFPFANWIGALLGAWFGLGFSTSIALGSYIYDPYRQTLPTNVINCTDYGQMWNVTKSIRIDPTDVPSLFLVSFHWFGALGTLICVGTGVIISLITGPMKSGEVDTRLIIPLCSGFGCRSPRKHAHIGRDDSVQTQKVSGTLRDTSLNRSDNCHENAAYLHDKTTGCLSTPL